MVVNISLECKSDSCKFSDRILTLEPSESINIGRADNNNRTDCDNGYFNCKVSLCYKSGEKHVFLEGFPFNSDSNEKQQINF